MNENEKREQKRIANKAYRLKNLERLREKNRNWGRANRDKIREYHTKWEEQQPRKPQKPKAPTTPRTPRIKRKTLPNKRRCYYCDVSYPISHFIIDDKIINVCFSCRNRFPENPIR